MRGEVNCGQSNVSSGLCYDGSSQLVCQSKVLITVHYSGMTYDYLCYLSQELLYFL